MEFEYGALQAERGKVEDILLDVGADLVVRAGATVVWAEAEVPVVELGLHLRLWIRRGAQTPFAYDSMERANPPFGWTPLGDGRWLVRSETAECTVPGAELTTSAERYLSSLARDCREVFGIDTEAHYASYPRRLQ